eukprot:6841591-Heterocapsa_arctica.AAC.1
MVTVYFVERKTRELIIAGGTVAHSTSMWVRKRENNQPESFWNTGVMTKGLTSLPPSDHMKTDDLCHEGKGKAKK